MNNSFSWSVHLLLKREKKLGLICNIKYISKKKKKISSIVKPNNFYLECVAKFETQAGCHHRLVHLNVNLSIICTSALSYFLYSNVCIQDANTRNFTFKVLLLSFSRYFLGTTVALSTKMSLKLEIIEYLDGKAVAVQRSLKVLIKARGLQGPILPLRREKEAGSIG